MDSSSRNASLVVLLIAGFLGGLFYARAVTPEAAPPGAAASTGDAEVDRLRARVAELEGESRRLDELIAEYEQELPPAEEP